MTVTELHQKCFHSLDTQRFHLRPLQLQDAEAMFAYTSVPESFRFLARNPHISADEDRAFIRDVQEGYRRHCEFIWGICPRNVNSFPIGTCRLFELSPDEGHCEVSYLIHPDFKRRGVASEAVERLVRYAFEELGFQTVFARCAAENIASERVMQKCGMTLEKTLPRHIELHGAWHDFLLYSIKRSETAV